MVNISHLAQEHPAPQLPTKSEPNPNPHVQNKISEKIKLFQPQNKNNEHKLPTPKQEDKNSKAKHDLGQEHHQKHSKSKKKQEKCDINTKNAVHIAKNPNHPSCSRDTATTKEKIPPNIKFRQYLGQKSPKPPPPTPKIFLNLGQVPAAAENVNSNIVAGTVSTNPVTDRQEMQHQKKKK